MSFHCIREMCYGASPLFLFIRIWARALISIYGSPKGNKCFDFLREMKGLIDLNNKDFSSLMGELKEYLEAQKVFIQDPIRFAEVERATEIAREIFKDMDISVEDDPLQMGALILCINGFDITVRGTREIKLFQELIDKADNFEIYPIGDEKVRFAILFSRVLTRIATQGKPQ